MDNYNRPKAKIIAQADTGFHSYKGIPGDLLYQTVLPIFAMSQNNAVLLGTGFIITNSGLVITAKHVVDNFIERDDIRDSKEPIENFGLYALCDSDKKHDCTSDFSDCFIGGPVGINIISTDVNLDIALCQLQSMQKIDTREFYQHKTLTLNFSVQQKEIKILGVGYDKGRFSKFTYEKKGKHTVKYLELNRKLVTTSGKITDVFKSQAHRHWPHFCCTSRFESGMSGGPVFAENGSVCGVICSSFNISNNEDGYISYVSELWPALSIKVDILLEGEKKTKKLTLYELMKMNLISTDDSKDKIEMISDKNTNTFKFKQ